MKDKNKFLSKILFIAIVGFAAFTLISLLGEILNINEGFIDLRTQSFREFFKRFEYTIQFLTATVAAVTLWLINLRAQQTKNQLKKMKEQISLAQDQVKLSQVQLENTNKQIEVMSDNNKFNNFYKHREMFNKDLNDSEIVKIIARYSVINTNQLLTIYYKHLFQTDYEKFEARISIEGKDLIDKLILALKNSNLNKSYINNLDDLNIEDLLKDFYDNLNGVPTFYLGDAAENILGRIVGLQSIKDTLDETPQLKNRKRIIDFYLHYYMVLRIIDFEGKEFSRTYLLIPFIFNIARVIKKMGFEEILLTQSKQYVQANN